MARIKVFDKTTQKWVYADKSYGESLTVVSTSESDADGGSNIVTFSDGKTLTVKNGSTGPMPVKGTDYWTDADQEAIVQQVITALGTPVFGRIKDDNKITLSSTQLVDGTYEVGYEDKNGNWVLIGMLNHTATPEPNYTNILDNVEILLNKRWSASGAAYKDVDGFVSFDLPWVSNFNLQSNDIVRMKGFPAMATNSAGAEGSWTWYDADGNNLSISFANASDGTSGYYRNNIWSSNYTDEGNGVYSYALNHDNVNGAYEKRNQIAFIRVSMIVKDGVAVTEEDVKNLIVTYNELIV